MNITNSHIEEPEIEEPGKEGCDSIDISEIHYIEMRNIVRQTFLPGRAAILLIATLIASFFAQLNAKYFAQNTELYSLSGTRVNFLPQNQFGDIWTVSVNHQVGKPFDIKTPQSVQLNHDFIKAHACELKVETIEGASLPARQAGSEFIIQLPIQT